MIGGERPDVVALQELDVGRSRTGGVDQARIIARCLEMEFHFQPTMHLEKGLYGNAVLSRLPMELIKAGELPGLPGRDDLEPRGAIWCRVQVDGAEVQLCTTHLGLRPKERWNQAEALLGPEWLGHPRCQKPVILCGDFNALPFWPVCRRLRERFRDAQRELPGHIPKSTFSGRYPLARIDHVFLDGDIQVLAVRVPDSERAIMASDHRPLIVDVGFGA